MVRYNGLVWSNIAVTFFYHPIYMIIALNYYFLHVWQVLEDKSLIKLGVEILPVDLGFIFWLLIRQQINFDKGISEASGPVSGRQVATLNNLEMDFKIISMQIFPSSSSILPSLSAPEW